MNMSLVQVLAARALGIIRKKSLQGGGILSSSSTVKHFTISWWHTLFALIQSRVQEVSASKMLEETPPVVKNMPGKPFRHNSMSSLWRMMMNHHGFSIETNILLQEMCHSTLAIRAFMPESFAAAKSVLSSWAPIIPAFKKYLAVPLDHQGRVNLNRARFTTTMSIFMYFFLEVSI